eukprot:1160658-Pelagomonas_calceolata.AAC.7
MPPQNRTASATLGPSCPHEQCGPRGARTAPCLRGRQPAQAEELQGNVLSRECQSVPMRMLSGVCMSCLVGVYANSHVYTCSHWEMQGFPFYWHSERRVKAVNKPPPQSVFMLLFIIVRWRSVVQISEALLKLRSTQGSHAYRHTSHNQSGSLKL